MNDKFLSFMGITKKSGNLFLGMDNVKDNILKKNIILILVTNDIAKSSFKKISHVAQTSNVKLFQINYSSKDIYFTLGKESVIMGISNENFAKKIISLITFNQSCVS